MKTVLNIIFFLLLALTISYSANAQVAATKATGGSAISADNVASATYTTLTGPILAEGGSGEITTGTIVLVPPAGFYFNTAGTTPTVLITGNPGNSNKNINHAASGTSAAITSRNSKQITFTVTIASTQSNTLTWQNISVIPAAGTPLASGNITDSTSGTSTMSPITKGSTSLGTLTEIAGAVNQFTFTTIANGKTAGTAFTVTTITALDQYGNTLSATNGNAFNSTVSFTTSAATGLVTPSASSSFSNGVLSNQSITVTQATTQSITATSGSASSNSNSFTVGAGAFTQLEVVMPGEASAPGSASGTSGSPTASTAGTAITVTVYACDAYWNVVSSTHTVAITSSDAGATLPTNAALVAGTKTFSVTFKTAGSQTVTATDQTAPKGSPNTGDATTVSAAAFSQLNVVMPGEAQAPGSATGTSGSAGASTAGTAITVTVYACDAYWNVITTGTGSNHTVAITSSDAGAVLPANAALSSGVKTFAVTFKTGGPQTVTATDKTTPNTGSPNTGDATIVGAGAFSQLNVVMPGEAEAPGSATGTTGSASASTAGTAITVTVYACDAYWNVVTTGTGSNHTVAITSSDANAVLPANAALVSGVQTYSVTLKTGGSQTVTATDKTTPNTGSPNTGDATIVGAGAFSQLNVVMPGEAEAPGSATGTSGTASASTAGTAITVTIYACDAYWNVVSSTHTVAITSSDAGATLPINAALVAGVKTFAVTFKTAGAQTVTATDQTAPKGSPNTGDATTVGAAAFSQLNVVMPGEAQAPGTATGTSGSASASTAGTAITVTVYACDAYYNVITTGTGSTHTVAITSSDASAVLPANAALVSGVQTFSVTFKTAGTQTVTATDKSTGPGSPNTGDATTVGAATASSFTFSAISTPTAGTAFPVTITAKDAYGNTATGFTGTAAMTTNAGTISPITSNAFTAGVLTETFTVTLASATVNKNITATSTTPSATGTSANFAVNVGAFTQLNVVMPGETEAPASANGTSGSASGSTAGTAITVTVYACDAYWNVVTTGTGFNHTVAITSSDGSAVLPANAALASGVQTFSVTFKTAGSETVTATDKSSGPGSPNTGDATTVGAATAASFTFSAISTPTAGTAFSVTITAKDAYGNTATGYSGTAAMSTTAGSISPTTTSNAFSAGILTESFTVTLASTTANKTITATFTSPSTSVTSNDFMVNPGLASTFTYSAIATQTAGTSFSVTITAKDANGNVATGFTGTTAMTTNAGTISSTTSNAFSAGVLTESFTVTAATATASRTITATSTSPSATGTSSGFIVNAIAFSKLQILLPGETASAGSATGKTGTPSAQTQGAAFTVTVNGVDAYWNVVSTATDVIHLVSSDGGATMPANASLSSGTITFSVTLVTTGSKTITASDVTNSLITSSLSAAVTVNTFVGVNTDYFKSNATGNWNATGTWTESHDNNTWFTATLTPDYNSAAIVLESPYTVSVSANVTADGVVINSGGQLNINDGITFTLNDGGGTDLDVYGTVEEIGTGSTGASINTSSGASIVFESTGIYIHNFSSTSTQGSVPTATWKTGSNCEIIGFVSPTIIHVGNLTQSFSVFTWNCPNQTVAYGLTASLTTVRDTFKMVSSGSTPQAVYGLGANPGGLTMNIGNIVVSGGIFDFANSAATGTFVLNLSGSYKQTGGTFQTDFTGGLTVNFTGTGSFTQTGGTLTTTNMSFNVNSGGTLTMNNNLSVSGSFTVSNGGILYTGTNAVTGSGSFTLSSGGTLGIGLGAGINTSGSSNIQTTSKSFSTGGNYIYDGSGTQSTGTALPSTIASLTVNNASVSTLTVTNAGTLTITNTLTLTKGLVVNASTVLYVTDTAESSVSGYSSSSYVEDSLRRAIHNTGTYDFPVGNSTNYELARVKLHSSTGITYLTGYYNTGLPATLPVFPTSTINGSPVLNMLNSGYWTVTPNTSTYTVNYDITLYESGYSASGVAASEMGIIKRHNSSDPWHGTGGAGGYNGLQGTHNDSTQTIINGTARAKRTGVQGFSDYGIGYGGTTLPITLTSFEADAVDNSQVDVNWHTASELNSNYFVVERSNDAVSFDSIGTVEASGTTVIAHDYSFVDYAPLIGTSYYRLDEVDLDGTRHYSNISAVTISVSNIFSVYPNPTTDGLNIKLNNNVLNKITVIGIDGKLYLQQIYSGANGIANLNISSLSAGIYMLSIDNGSAVNTTKFIKQ